VNKTLESLRGDVEFEGIRWSDDFTDIVLYLRPPAGASGIVVREVCCRSVADLEVAMNWCGNAANAMSWDIEWQSISKDRWSVRMDFRPHGFISLNCLEVAVDGQVVIPDS